MKVIIIGAKGFIGKNLLHFIQKKGIEVQGFSSSEPGNIDQKTGILSDEFRIPDGTTVVIYLAQSPHYYQIPEMLHHIVNVNVASAVRMAELARKAKVRRFIYASTGNAYRPSFQAVPETAPVGGDNGYVITKIFAEKVLSLFNKYMDIIIIRPFGIYGPGQTNKLVPNLLNSLLREQEIHIEKNPHDRTDIDGLKISLCCIEDAVKMLYKLITDGGPDYLNIAGDRAVSIREMVTIMAKYLGKEPRFKLSENCRHSDLIADVSLLKNTLNPEFTDIQDGLRATVDAAIKESDRQGFGS